MKASIVDTQNKITATLHGAKYLSIYTDGIEYTLTGSGMANWLKACGFNVVSFQNIEGSNGQVELDNGVIVSTNGYCWLK